MNIRAYATLIAVSLLVAVAVAAISAWQPLTYEASAVVVLVGQKEHRSDVGSGIHPIPNYPGQRQQEVAETMATAIDTPRGQRDRPTPGTPAWCSGRTPA